MTFWDNVIRDIDNVIRETYCKQNDKKLSTVLIKKDIMSSCFVQTLSSYFTLLNKMG